MATRYEIKKEVKKLTTEIRRMRTLLFESIELEAYEKAAQLRDDIKLKQQKLINTLGSWSNESTT